jgi:hypothetical protein
MKKLSAIVVSCLLSLSAAQSQTGEQYLQQQLRLANAGNYWAKYNLWDAYTRGKHGLAKDPVEASKWLPELVKGVYLAKFQPADGFNPGTPKEMFDKFNQYCHLLSGKDSLGAASFFRTKKQGDKLIGSFLTTTPDQFKTELEKNPNFKLLSMEKVTPEVFLAHESSRQESLGSAQPQTGETYVQQQLRLANAGNYWAKYNLWDAYSRGKHGVAKDPAEASKWLPELVKGVYLAKFQPADGFNPGTPKEMFDKFGQYCHLLSGKDSLGGASFFRTKKQGDKLIGSFLTTAPDQFKTELKKNPNLTLISVEKVTPEMFLAHEVSRQESL